VRTTNMAAKPLEYDVRWKGHANCVHCHQNTALAHTASSSEGQLPECRIKGHVQLTRGGHLVLEADGD